MGGVTRVGTERECLGYCTAEGGEESEPICKSPSADGGMCIDEERRASLACGDSSSLVPVAATTSSGPDGPFHSKERDEGRTGGSSKPLHRTADYVTVTGGIGVIVGASASVTFDRHGHVYFALGAGVSLSPFLGSGAVSAGQMADGIEEPDDGHLKRLLEGDALNATGGVGGCVGVTNSPGGTGVEIGVCTPQIGGEFQHSWDIYDKGPRW
jgi:hypothetical protein